ncbi:hypothetical protein H8356DRAFT_1427955 [Neocallimastix lanati (nom. inval.)]|nr:hypothetical protein H8356DRAFT_1427955 [Neocallimastix sp. JGI-2020a]
MLLTAFLIENNINPILAIFNIIILPGILKKTMLKCAILKIFYYILNQIIINRKYKFNFSNKKKDNLKNFKISYIASAIIAVPPSLGFYAHVGAMMAIFLSQLYSYLSNIVTS